MKNTVLATALGVLGGTVAGVLVGKCIASAKMRSWRNHMERKQTDTDIRLALIEYNHLHEDDNLAIYYENE